MAQEVEAALLEAGVPRAELKRERASPDTQLLGEILVVAAAAAPYVLPYVEEFMKGAAHRAGGRVLDAILRKWGTRARVHYQGKPAAMLGEQYKRVASVRTPGQAQTLSELNALGVVLLGASAFPHYPRERSLDNPAFKRSAELARDLLSPAYTVFREAHVLDLFDQELRPDEIVDRIENFLEGRKGVRDVVLYYCGHGDFMPDRERTYYVLLKGTRPGREPATALAPKAFRAMIEHNAVLSSRRCTFVLDCCFAGAAVDAFQLVDLDPMIEAQVRDLPTRGFALLTATSRDLPAFGRDGQGATMFTGALAEVLTARTPPQALSLGDLCSAMTHHIKAKHGQAGVLPQCRPGDQTDGDVTRIPMFVTGMAHATTSNSSEAYASVAARMEDSREPALSGQTRPEHFRSADPATWGKVSRNEPCPCASGKKYKHCHGRYEDAALSSARGDGGFELYLIANSFVEKLTQRDCEVDPHSGALRLTSNGYAAFHAFAAQERVGHRAEARLLELLSFSLSAHKRYVRDHDYIVRGGKIHVIDRVSGRPNFGQRFANGLHQAIEAKEMVEITPLG
ncbi:MAG: hypothetical protein F9K29_18270 [Hyphomicrobiaceae bacterium]|nr:MAG: hypothetical protein F9K29_18270 [Hyphomicrobiaceae bacterium]